MQHINVQSVKLAIDVTEEKISRSFCTHWANILIWILKLTYSVHFLPLPFFQNHYLYIFAPSVSDFFCSLLPLFFNHPFTNSLSLFCYVHRSHSVSKQNFLVYRKILRIVVRSEIIKIPSHRIHTHLLSLNTWLSSQVADSKLEEWKITKKKPERVPRHRRKL